MPNDYPQDMIDAGETPYDKVVVMMTDGYNNITYECRNRDDGHYTSYGKPDWERLNTSSDDGIQNAINSRTLDVCIAMKAKGIVIYTITFDTEGSAYEDISDLYRNCATRPAHYFNSPTGNELSRAFIAIGTQLANLRLAR